MTAATATPDPWRPERPWQIVRADLDLAHVFMPLSNFRFEQVNDPKLGIGYKIVHGFQAPHPNCFCDTFLRPAGKTQPSFETAAKRKTLNAYDSNTAADYKTVTSNLLEFLDRDHEVRRLEGFIKVPCHALGGPQPDDALTGHSPLWMKTLLHVYQFESVIDGDRPFLLLRAPLAPLCPTNNDGSAVGLA